MVRVRPLLVPAIALLAALGRPAPAATAPKVVLDVPLLPVVAVSAVFVAEGRQEFLEGTIDADLQLLDDSTFTISGGNLPLITGRWITAKAEGSEITSLWAKTAQISLNGQLIPYGQGGLLLDYFVQVNAPRTDGGESEKPAAGVLKPTSMHVTQLLVSPRSQ